MTQQWKDMAAVQQQVRARVAAGEGPGALVRIIAFITEAPCVRSPRDSRLHWRGAHAH